MSDISNQLIKDSYNYVLQSDISTGIVYRIGGVIPVNPIFLSGLTINSTFTFADGSESNGYVLTSDASGNATWKPVTAATPSTGVTSINTGTGLSADSTTGAVTIINTSPNQTVTISGGTNIQITGTYPDFGINYTGQTSFPYLALSGGTVTGVTIFQSGLTANTISATTYYNLPIDPDTYVTGLTLSSNTITLTQNRTDQYSAFTISLSAYTGTSISGLYLPLSGGTVTGRTIFQSGLTANTISATTYQNLPSQSGTGISAFSYNQSTGLLTITKNDTNTLTAGTFNYVTATTLSATNVLSVTSNGGSPTTTTINAVTGGTYSNGTITLSGTGSVNGTQITGLSALTPTTLYSGNGTLSGNRIVNIDGYTLNFSGSGATNNLVLSGSNVGIGKLSPSYKLDVNGDINFPTTTGSTYGIIRQNGNRILHTYGTDNLFLGKNSGNFTTSGVGINVGIGPGVLQENTIGSQNVGIGGDSLNNNTVGYYNTSIGYYSLRSNTQGYDNVAIGAYSLSNNSGGYYNVAIGVSALQNNNNGANNVAIGTNAGLNETGSNKLYIANTYTKTLIYGEFDNNRVGINTTSLSNAFTVSATTDPVKFIGLQSASDTNVLTVDGTGVVHTSPISGLTTGLTTTNIYNSNGTLSGNRIVNLSSYTLNFSSSTNPDTLVMSGRSVGIGTTSLPGKFNIDLNNTNYTNTSGADSHILMTNPNGTGQNVISSVINGNVVAKWRTDYVGNINWVAGTTGAHAFYTGGDFGVGRSQMCIFNNGNIKMETTTIGGSNVDNGYKLDVIGISRFSATTNPLKLEGVQTSTDTELLTIDGSGVIHKVSSSSVGGAFLRNETNSGATDTITINQSIFNPSDLTVLSTSVFIVDTNADYYILGDLYNNGNIIVNGTLKVGGIIYNYGTITGSGIIE